jgi:hypothetical protein
MRHHSSGYVHDDAPDVFTHNFDLSGVEPGAHVDPEPFGGAADPLSASDGSSWTVEGGEDPITRCLDETATMPTDLIIGLGAGASLAHGRASSQPGRS